MRPNAAWLLCLATAAVRAQDGDSITTINGGSSSSSSTSTSSDSGSSSSGPSTKTSTNGQGNIFVFTNSYSTLTGTRIPTSAFTGSEFTYLTPTAQRTVTTFTQTFTTNGSVQTVTGTSTMNPQITVSSRSVDLTIIGALPSNSSSSVTRNATTTTSSIRPTNTVPCNGFPEFCTRKYSNITMVTAHNAAFVVKNNAASNQQLPILDQLNDGIRMLQGQVHWENDTLWNCHTSCEVLNAGMWQAELDVVRGWLQNNRNEVLTILIGNSDRRPPSDFVAPLTNAGLIPYLYEPAYVPQYRDQWPSLGEMILTNKRLVIFMDYGANQDDVPYILDEFTHMWETPFSPTDPTFPCTQERPPDLNQTVAREQYMYMANHNLNVAVDLSSIGITISEELLIPNTASINETNGEQNLTGRLGAMSVDCTAEWGRPPNFLLVDYYNYGSPEPGSVFEVAAAANGVTYTQKCCGGVPSAASLFRVSSSGFAATLLVTALLNI